MLSVISNVLPMAGSQSKLTSAAKSNPATSKLCSCALLKTESAFGDCCNAFGDCCNGNQALLTAESNYGCCCGSCYVPYRGGGLLGEDA